MPITRRKNNESEIRKLYFSFFFRNVGFPRRAVALFRVIEPFRLPKIVIMKKIVIMNDLFPSIVLLSHSIVRRDGGETCRVSAL